MPARALYFPRVPEDEWFTRALLYWDTVGTINCPAGLEDDPRYVTARMRELIKNDLLQPVYPVSPVVLTRSNFSTISRIRI